LSRFFKVSSLLAMLIDELRIRCLESCQYYKVKAYDTAIRSVNYHNKPISSGKDAMLLPGIGKGIAAMIEEVITTVNNLYMELITGLSKAIE
jgi:DNA polymerase/3'-5' exonuclease PolX